MTIYERLNAATYLEFTTIKPFFYQQANFKCFYCPDIFPEIQSVLQHTAFHSVPDRSCLLKQYLRKGKRVIKVDISNLRCKICDQKYSDLDDIRKHLIVTHKREFNSAGNGLMEYDLSIINGVLSCHKCGKTFNSFFLLNRHMNAHFSVVCETCGLGFISHQRLINHRIVHQIGMHKCDKCQEVYPTKLKLRYHILKRHEVSNSKRSKPLKCPHCLERFAEHYRKMTHLKEAHGISFTFECQLCSSGRKGALTSIWEMTLSERKNAAILLESTTAPPFIYCRYFFKCFFCCEHYSEIHSLLKHTSEHIMPDTDKILQNLLPKGKRTVKIDISDLKCKICNKHFVDIDQIRQHLVKEHEKVFTPAGNGVVGYNLSLQDGLLCCHICSKTFQTFILLNRHMNVHFSNAVCEICGAGFMTYQRLIQHKEIHSPGGYPCSKCSKVYTTKSNLKYHIEKYHNGATKMRMLRCPHCPERFTEHFRKLKHFKEAHQITFTYKCDICKLKFSSRRSLTTHTNKYHTQKTFCGICRKSFSCVSTLKKHMLAHTGQKNFSCALCKKSYGQQKSLNRHMRMHIDDCSKLACCGNSFQNKNDFNDHVTEWHSNIFYNFSH